MKQFITADRIRSMIAGCKTEKDAADILRRHRIRYEYSTIGGAFHIRVYCRTGAVRIIRTASRSAPLIVAGASAAPFPFPGPRPFYY